MDKRHLTDRCRAAPRPWQPLGTYCYVDRISQSVPLADNNRDRIVDSRLLSHRYTAGCSMTRYERMVFWDVYSTADAIWREIMLQDDRGFCELYLRPNHEVFRQRIAKPHRYTLLHDFIDHFYTTNLDAWESLAEWDTVVDEYMLVLESYEILSKHEMEMMVEESNKEEEEPLSSYDIMIWLRTLLPIPQIVNNIFQILFSNREFLHQFSLEVAKSIKNMRLSDYPNMLERDGILRRESLPTWAKKGVFFRDRGKCIRCGKDLTGTIVTGEELHYDHIVALAEGGSNDPTNFQLLCGPCNLSKGKRQTGTSNLYPVYWEMQ